MLKTTVTASVIAAFALVNGASALPVTTSGTPQSAGHDVGYILAQTQGTDRRTDRRGDRKDDRGDRKDDRQDCKKTEKVAGKDKRDCKQDGRQDRNSNG